MVPMEHLQQAVRLDRSFLPRVPLQAAAFEGYSADLKHVEHARQAGLVSVLLSTGIIIFNDGNVGSPETSDTTSQESHS